MYDMRLERKSGMEVRADYEIRMEIRNGSSGLKSQTTTSYCHVVQVFKFMVPD